MKIHTFIPRNSYTISIITQVIIEMGTLWLVEDSIISRYNHHVQGDYSKSACVLYNVCEEVTNARE